MSCGQNKSKHLLYGENGDTKVLSEPWIKTKFLIACCPTLSLSFPFVDRIRNNGSSRPWFDDGSGSFHHCFVGCDHRISR